MCACMICIAVAACRTRTEYCGSNSKFLLVALVNLATYTSIIRCLYHMHVKVGTSPEVQDEAGSITIQAAL